MADGTIGATDANHTGRGTSPAYHITESLPKLSACAPPSRGVVYVITRGPGQSEPLVHDLRIVAGSYEDVGILQLQKQNAIDHGDSESPSLMSMES